jgi:hypothetical protein
MGMDAELSKNNAGYDEILSLERFNDSPQKIEKVIALLKKEQLKLNRIALDTVRIDLTPEHQKKFHEYSVLSTNRRNVPIIPYALVWLQQHNETADFFRKNVIRSLSETHVITVGRPSLGVMLEVFERDSKMVRQCFIPEIKKRDNNEMLIFERGPDWHTYVPNTPEF